MLYKPPWIVFGMEWAHDVIKLMKYFLVLLITEENTKQTSTKSKYLKMSCPKSVGHRILQRGS